MHELIRIPKVPAVGVTLPLLSLPLHIKDKIKNILHRQVNGSSSIVHMNCVMSPWIRLLCDQRAIVKESWGLISHFMSNKYVWLPIKSFWADDVTQYPVPSWADPCLLNADHDVWEHVVPLAKPWHFTGAHELSRDVMMRHVTQRVGLLWCVNLQPVAGAVETGSRTIVCWSLQSARPLGGL